MGRATKGSALVEAETATYTANARHGSLQQRFHGDQAPPVGNTRDEKRRPSSTRATPGAEELLE